MRSKHGSWTVWLAALVIVLGPLSTLRAAETAPAAEKPAEKPAAKEAASSSASTEKAADSAPAKDANADATKDAAKDPQADAAKDGQAAKGEQADKPEVHHKSPGLAGGLAFFPGIALHGTGHMYAGSWVKGLGLLAMEGAAVGIAVAAVNNGVNDVQKLSDGTKNGAIPTNVGTAYQTVGVALVSTMAFLWTWFDDMAGAPIAAKEYNRLADEAAGQARLQIAPQGDGAALALVKHF